MSKDAYPKMLYRSDDAHGATPVFGKEGVFYAIVQNAKAESDAKKNGFRESVYPKK